MSETKVEETKTETKAETKPAETKTETKVAKVAELKMEDTAAIAEPVEVETPAEPVQEAIESAPKTSVSKTKEKVLYVDHGTYWPEVGNLQKGFNLVSAADAKKWTDKGWAREATAKEVKEFYGVK